MFLTDLKVDSIFSDTSILSSANAFTLGESKIYRLGKGLFQC